MTLKNNVSRSSPTICLESEAEVIACRYDFNRISTLSCGIASGAEGFSIRFTYRVNCMTFCDAFQTNTPLGRGAALLISYSAFDPRDIMKVAIPDLMLRPAFFPGIVG
jgi:hypothetical protein